MKMIIAILGASVALSLSASAQAPSFRNSGAPANPGVPTWQLPANSGQVGVQMPGVTQTGQRFEWAPARGHIGQVLGPVTPDAYGPGIGMDATGKPVRAIVK